MTMDWNRVEGNWKQTKGKVKEKWGHLTDHDQRQARPARRQDPGALWLGKRHGAQGRRRLAEGTRQSRLSLRAVLAMSATAGTGHWLVPAPLGNSRHGPFVVLKSNNRTWENVHELSSGP